MDEAIKDQLRKAYFSQKRNEYPIYERCQWDRFKLPEGMTIDDSTMLTIQPLANLNKDSYREPTWNEMIEKRERSTRLLYDAIYYTPIHEILNKYHGKLVVAGGALTEQWFPKDMDIYFINCTQEEMLEIIDDCSKIIKEYRLTDTDIFYKPVVIKDIHNLIVERLMIFEDHRKNEKTEFERYQFERYQFIAKNYSSIGELLGSFDMFASQICYDGNKIWATEGGAWAFVNNICIVDITRISHDFARRIYRYGQKLFDFVIPGLAKNPVGGKVIAPKNRTCFPIETFKNDGYYKNNQYQILCKTLVITHLVAPSHQNYDSYWCDKKNGMVIDQEKIKIDDLSSYVMGNRKVSAEEFYYPTIDEVGQTFLFDRQPCYIFFSSHLKISPQVMLLLAWARGLKDGNFISWLSKDLLRMILSKDV